MGDWVHVQIKYVDDDSTLFWAVGNKLSVLASRAELCGKEVTLTVPLENATGEVLSFSLSPPPPHSLSHW
jgi:hypothetical protein